MDLSLLKNLKASCFHLEQRADSTLALKVEKFIKLFVNYTADTNFPFFWSYKPFYLTLVKVGYTYIFFFFVYKELSY